MKNLEIDKVMKRGKLVTDQSEGLSKVPLSAPKKLTNSVHIKSCTKEHLKLPVDGSLPCSIIEIIPNSLVTNHIKETVQTRAGEFLPCTENDQLKLAVVERHKATGKIGIGIVKGLQLKKGAIASTVAHDSHNIVAVGTNDEDLLVAIQTLQEIEGGLVIVSKQKPIATLPLEIAGLMTEQPLEQVLDHLHNLHHSLTEIGMELDFNPFVTLSFLSLPVIPALKITESGLFDVTEFRHISIQ
jgi:adenine deaminase